MLATILGRGNIIENAENAVGKYNEEVNKEKETLNSIEKFLIEKTDINEPIVRAKQESITIIFGEKHDLSNYFEIDANGALNIKDIVYSIQDTSTLPVGEHVVTCTATKENGKSSSASILIIVKLAYTEQSWTEAGTYSWTCPDKTYRIRIALCGGGGGSAIGNAGTATAGNGESSSFGDLISVSGGNGGESSSGQGGTGGTPNGRNGAYSSGSLQTINGGTGFELSFTLSNGAYGSGGNGWIDKRGAVISTGGSGGYYTGYIDVIPNQTYTIIVGKNGSNSINSWDVNDSVWGGSSGFVLIGFGGDI